MTAVPESDAAAVGEAILAPRLRQPSARDVPPEVFEPALRDAPENGEMIDRALVWYYRVEDNSERLRHHTRLALRYFPWMPTIFQANRMLFLIDPEWKKEVQDSLSWALVEPGDHGVAMVYQRAEVASLGVSDDEGISAWRAAHEFVTHNTQGASWLGLVLAHLCRLLSETDRHEEAIVLLDGYLQRTDRYFNPGAQTMLARCALKAGRRDRSRVALQAAIEEDRGSPGDHTIYCHLQLGVFALDDGDSDAATEALSKALGTMTAMPPPRRPAVRRMPLWLAEQMAERGFREPVFWFCHALLGSIMPDDSEVKNLLDSVSFASEP